MVRQGNSLFFDLSSRHGISAVASCNNFNDHNHNHYQDLHTDSIVGDVSEHLANKSHVDHYTPYRQTHRHRHLLNNHLDNIFIHGSCFEIRSNLNEYYSCENHYREDECKVHSHGLLEQSKFFLEFC